MCPVRMDNFGGHLPIFMHFWNGDQLDEEEGEDGDNEERQLQQLRIQQIILANLQDQRRIIEEGEILLVQWTKRLNKTVAFQVVLMLGVTLMLAGYAYLFNVLFCLDIVFGANLSLVCPIAAIIVANCTKIDFIKYVRWFIICDPMRFAFYVLAIHIWSFFTFYLLGVLFLLATIATTLGFIFVIQVALIQCYNTTLLRLCLLPNHVRNPFYIKIYSLVSKSVFATIVFSYAVVFFAASCRACLKFFQMYNSVKLMIYDDIHVNIVW